MYRNRYKYIVPCLSAWIRKQKHSGKKVLLLKSLPSAVAFIYTAGGIAAGILLVIGIAGTQRYLHPTPENYVIIDGKQYTVVNLVHEQALAAFRDMRTTEDEVLDLMFE